MPCIRGRPGAPSASPSLCVKLLLDQNLSFKLVRHLLPVTEYAAHVGEIGLGSASDQTVWEYARNHHYTIVSKDTDFLHRALLYGAPPKIICLRLGNASTQDILHCLQQRWKDIESFDKSADETVLILP